MLEEPPISYRHTQWAPWHLVLDAIGVALLVAAWLSNEPHFARWLFVGMAILFLLLGASFRHLTVEDQGDYLDIHFGPLPLFRRQDSIRGHPGCRGRQDGAAGKLGRSHESPRWLGLEHLGA